MLPRYIVNITSLENYQLVAADVKIDGKVDVTDPILILSYIVGLLPELPVPAE